MHTWPDISAVERALALMLQGNPHFAWQIGDGSYRPCGDARQLERFAEDILAGVNAASWMR